MRITLSCITCNYTDRYEPVNLSRIDDAVIELIFMVFEFKELHKGHETSIFNDAMMCWNKL
jgi:hypothetical protein